MLEKDGLVIEHYLQRHKVTVDRPAVVSKASYDEKYDIVFSVMQGQQQLTVLEELTKVNTKLIVMVGNNLEGDHPLWFSKFSRAQRGWKSGCGSPPHD